MQTPEMYSVESLHGIDSESESESNPKLQELNRPAASQGSRMRATEATKTRG